MSFASLLLQRATVKHMGVLATDRRNNQIIGETSRDTDVPTRLRQLSAEERLVAGDVSGSMHLAHFLPGQAVSEADVIEVDGKDYRVVGPPAPRYDGIGLHHWEATVQYLSSLDRMYP